MTSSTKRDKNFKYSFIRNQNSSKVLTKQLWILDTVVDAAFAAKLDSICTYFTENRKVLKSCPASVIHDVQVHTGTNQLNYRLQFWFKDVRLNIPVKIEGETDDLRKKNNAKFRENYQHALNLDNELEKAITLMGAPKKNDSCQLLRQKIINKAIKQSKWLGTFKSAPQQLHFELPQFGMINCDYLAQLHTNQNLQLSSELVDSIGKKYTTPPKFRCVHMQSNYYMECTSIFDKSLQIEANSLLVFELGKDLIGIVQTGSETNVTVNTIQVVNIANKSAEALTSLIWK